VVIDRGVDVVVADLHVAADVVLTTLATCSPAAAVGDLAELLDVDVDQVAGTGSFVTQGGGLAGSDDFSGQWIALTQVGHPVTAQDRCDRAWGEAELGTEPVLSAALGAPQLEHLLLEGRAGSARTSVWT
jgi:hypothetical protein